MGKLTAMELLCHVQRYAWGKLGRSSSVAILSAGNDPNFIISEVEPYAEFWMGTHPNGPSTISNLGITLRDWLEQNPEALGTEARSQFGNDLSFLFKVLSVNIPLSIQAHPTKKHAEQLHKKFPDIYKDANHKPEMAIALTPFEVLAGFRPYYEIKQYLDDVPEFRKLVAPEYLLRFLKLDDDKTLLKEVFECVMKQSTDVVADAVVKLLHRLSIADEKTQSCQMFKLLKRLNVDFCDDVGIFCIYFLNYIVLSPGDSLYLPSNLPHAYISGDCVECMSCSDNVVRAGFTAKFKDVETLVSMLDYRSYTPSSLLFKGLQLDKCTLSFAPPIKDFAVSKITVPKNVKYSLIKQGSVSILLVFSGEGTLNVDDDSLEIELGSVFVIPAQKIVSVLPVKDMVLFQAFTNGYLDDLTKSEL